MQKVIRHFEAVDPQMAELARKHKLKPSRRPTENRFEYLALTILYQQLSTKAAGTIAGRFRALYKTKDFPKPAQILKTPDEALRGVGISWSKIKYIKDLAEKVQKKEVELEEIEELEDEAVIAELIKVKGIGRWTAEMFLMSALGRPDIFSLGDLGLKTAIKKLYGYKQLPSDRTILRHSRLWSPHRTTAARLLWASLDNE